MQQKAILITGANGGMGTALVPYLLKRKWIVYAGMTNMGHSLPSHQNLIPIMLDVTNPKSIAVAAQTIAKQRGDAGLQAVVNLAGIIVQGPIEIVPEAEMRKQFEVSFFGPFLIMQQFLPILRSGKGRIVNVTALSAILAAPFYGPISASKAALSSITDAARMELKRWGIPVIAVVPGAMQTSIFKRAQTAFERSLMNISPNQKALYADMIRDATAVISKQKASPVEVVVNALMKAIEDPNPKARYLAGPDAKMLDVLSHFPLRIRDFLISRAMGVSSR